MKDGALDAFFFVGGAPAGAIAELASSGTGIELIAIDGPQADALRKASPFFAVDNIPADTYKGVPGGADAVGRRAVGDERQGRHQHGVRDHEGALQRQRRKRRCRPATPRAS